MGTGGIMSHQTEKINKDTEIMKRNEIEILELKSIITEMKNSVGEFQSKFDQA